MPTVWRISQFNDLSGRGGLFAAGRWNHLGTEIVYCSDHPSTCLLELLVRFNPERTPSNYRLLEIKLTDKVAPIEAKPPKGWQKKSKVTQEIWDAFCKKNTAPVLKVPSVIMPQATHYLLNPNHIDHGKHKIVGVYDNLLDERFYV